MVAIIALLVAVLLPSLQQARVQSRRVACGANLKQLAAGWQQYLDAHKGRFFRGPADANLNYGGRQGLGGPMFEGPKPLNRFVGLPPVATAGAEIFRCPADAGVDEVQPTFFEFVGTSYDTNPYLVGQDDFFIYRDDPCAEVLKQVRQRLPGLTRSAIVNEPLVPLLGDVGWVEQAHFKSERRLDWHGRRAWYHLGFMDSHVEFLKVRKGLQVNARYSLIPFQDLQRAAAAVQREVTGE